jgi:hypothetical protein
MNKEELEAKLIELQEEATTKWSSENERKRAYEEYVKLIGDKDE